MGGGFQDGCVSLVGGAVDALFSWRGIPGARLSGYLENCRGRGLRDCVSLDMQTQNWEGTILTPADRKTEIFGVWTRLNLTLAPC